MTDMHKVAFIGVGHMGGPMAANLARAGHAVTVFDISEELMSAVVAHGATAAASGVEAVADADVVITMLPGGKFVLDAYRDQGLLDAAKPGALLIDSSTIDVFEAREFHELATSRGFAVVDAPVSGGVVGAEAGTLTFMVGGTEIDFARATPLLEAMGKRLVHCGAAGAGQAAKLCNNMLLAISMVGAAEAFALAKQLGLSDQAFFDVASTSSGNCWAVNVNAPVPGVVDTSAANNDYRPGFAVALMQKDLRLAQAAADATHTHNELGRHALEIYERFSDELARTKDFGAVYQMITDTLPTEAGAPR
ncbi:MAG: 3-hydroxyisobutyrate dehydrogenase [Thermoleophilia bacterium]|jgi:3-hydroxyisobutyrate dehydrogenase|nr:3-hydroxyisobutyrate dehydrogenase [Thermoleophilia bacterium]